MRREEADGVVAPVVAHPLLGEPRLGGELLHRQQLDGGDAEVAQVVDDGGRGQAGVGAAQLLGHPVVQRGEPLDVQLVDHGVGPADLRPDLPGPVEAVVGHDHPVQDVRGRVALVAGEQLVARRTRVVVVGGPHEAVDRVVGADGAGDRAGVGVEQQLGGVEAPAALGLPRAVGAEAVALAGPHPRQRAVPDAQRALGQQVPGLDQLAVRAVVEQAHRHRRGLGRPHGEVGRLRRPGGAERLVAAGPERGLLVMHGPHCDRRPTG